MFSTTTVTLLSLELCYPNLVQRYFEIMSIFCGKKNQDQIHSDVIFALIHAKTGYFEIAAATLCFTQFY